MDEAHPPVDPLRALADAVATADLDDATPIVERAVRSPLPLLGVASGTTLAAGALTVVRATFVAGTCTAPHDHAGWVVTGCLSGRSISVIHHRADGALLELGRRVLDTGRVQVLRADEIHAVVNPWSEPCEVVQVRSGSRDRYTTVWDPVTHAAHLLPWAHALAPLHGGVDPWGARMRADRTRRTIDP